MAQVKVINTICGIMATAVASTFSYQGACDQMDINLQEPSCQMSSYEPLDDLPENTYYRILPEESIIYDRIDALHNLVSNLVEKSEDLDPKFSASVDKHFWDLV